MNSVVSEISWLYVPPLWASFLIFLTIFLLAIEIGIRNGLRIYRSNKKAGIAARGDATIGALLALLGLLLAFTYAFGLSRYDQRKTAIVEEVNALGTAFLRADLLPEPGRTDLRSRLLDYARTRLLTRESLRTVETLQRALDQSLRAQARIWPATIAALEGRPTGAVEVAIIAAVNTVLDVHTKRVVAGFDNIPAVILVLLILVSAFCLAVTAHNSGVQGNTSRWRMFVFALVLAALTVIIMDFDLPQRGLIQVSPMSMKNLIQDMETELKF